MTVVYSSQTINSRLLAVANDIDGGGSNGLLKLVDSSTSVVSQMQFTVPCGTVSSDVLTFSVPLHDPQSVGGVPVKGIVTNSAGTVVASCLTVGLTSAFDIVLNSSTTTIVPHQAISLTAASITGS